MSKVRACVACGKDFTRRLRLAGLCDACHFWAGVDRSGGADACWLWLRGAHCRGYGKTTWDGRADLTHRVAYMVSVGTIPGGLVVRHRCDERNARGDTSYRRCVNPAHLCVGTHADNAQDRVLRCRSDYSRPASGERHMSRTKPWAVRRGERIHKAKFTEEDVREIRRAFAAGETAASIGRRLGHSDNSVGRIIRGERWAHVA